ncbi:LPS translocon maturation chaperone LptM [Undibacterium terreum]|uniref:LPS translocon maturation chaperone LptM n=1 Tax=Undibacterium terreum TaxID=1224302 RepID=UPI003530E06F
MLAILKTHTPTPAIALLSLALLSLSACGQRGPLYLPKKPAGIATSKTQPVSTPSNVPADVSAPVTPAPPPVEDKDN